MNIHAAAAVAIMAIVTIALRFIPFLAIRGDKPTPAIIEYLGKVLPYAIMGMLVIYCVRGISFAKTADWAPIVIASALVAGLHVAFKNTLLSILGGTVCYMLLVQMVFV